MALRVAPSASFLQAFLPIVQNTAKPTVCLPLWQRWQSSLLPAVSVPLPGIFSDLWESILRAVPKKKTSHMKKRHRQMAGKALKDVTALNTCSSCGRQKRAHILCPYCVASIKRWFTTGKSPKKTGLQTTADEPIANRVNPPQESTSAARTDKRL